MPGDRRPTRRVHNWRIPMGPHRISSRRLLSVVAAAVTCGCSRPAAESVPYTTTFSTVGDTVIASTTGDVPETLIRHLVVDWRVRTESAPEIIGDVNSLAVGGDGQVWVWDGSSPALWLISAEGTLMRRVGRRGSGPGEYQSANGIAVARDGALVMWDDGNGRLTFFSQEGAYRTSASLAFADCCELPVTIDTLDRIWLTTRPRMIRGDGSAVDPVAMIRNEIGYLRYDASGILIDTIMAPTLPGRDATLSALQVTSDDFRGAIVQVPYATYPRQAVSPLGHVVAAMARPYAVHTEANGQRLRVTREFKAPTVAEEERVQLRANIEFFMRRERQDFRWNGPDIPHQKPPIAGIAVGLDGRIWVQVNVPSEAFEPEPLTGSSRDRAPLVRFRPREKQWDVFEPDGRYLGRIAAPRAVDVHVTRGNYAWGVMRDANDVAEIVRFRIDPGM